MFENKDMLIKKIFDIFSIVYFPIVLILFILYFKLGGVLFGDSGHSGDIYTSLTILNTYLVLSVIHIILLFIVKNKKTYFLITFVNLSICNIFTFTFYGLLVLAFGGIIIAGPLALILFILWTICIVKILYRWLKQNNDTLEETDNNDAQSKKTKNILYYIYFIFIFALIFHIIFALNLFNNYGY